MDRDFEKCVQRKNLDESCQICINAELLSGDGHGQIDGNRGPKLEADQGLGGAVKSLHTKSGLKPPEKQLDLLTLLSRAG